MKRIIFLNLVFFFLFINYCISQWVQVPNGMGSNKKVWALGYSGNFIFAGTSDNGVYYSTNNGSNWLQSSLNNKSVISFATGGTNVYAGSNGYGVYFSTNNGVNWIQSGLNNGNAHSLAILGNYIFAGTDNGVYRSTNNGINWNQVGLSNGMIYALAVFGTDIFAGVYIMGNTNTYAGVYCSTNNGINWSGTGLIGKSVISLAVNSNTIFAGVGGTGVYRTTNNGVNWNQTSLVGKTILSLTTNSVNIFAGTTEITNTGVYLSNNNGVNWIVKNQGFSVIPQVNVLLIANNYIFAGTGEYSTGNSVWRRSYSEIIGIQSTSTEIPLRFSLTQNYPNPFNPSTKIKFDIPKSSFVRISVFDISGREVDALVNERLQAGSYQADWNASSFSSGVYFYKINADNYTETKKMLLIK